VLKLELRSLFRESICLTTLILRGDDISVVAIISQSALEGSLICRRCEYSPPWDGPLKAFTTMGFWETQSELFRKGNEE